MSNPPPFSTLPPPRSWAVLRVSGADAADFLQGQLSSDVARVAPDAPGWTSYNSPKGRMLAVARLTRPGECTYALHLPASLAEVVARRLRMFVLRARATIEIEPPPCDDTATERLERVQLIEAGVPVIYPQTQDRWVAQMANLDLIDGISFDKGCYTGQEVVARLHYLGNLKKRLYRLDGSGAPPPPGSAIRDGRDPRQSVGDIVDAVATGEGFSASAVLQVSAADCEHLVLVRDTDPALGRAQTYAYA